MKFRYLIFLLTLVLRNGITLANTQQKADSLQRMLAAEKDPGHKFLLQNQLIEIYNFTNKLKAAGDISALVRYAQESGKANYQATAFCKWSNLLTRINKIDSAEIILNKANALLENNGPPGEQAEYYLTNGLILKERRNFSDAINYLQRSYEVYDSLHDFNGKASAMLEMGKIILDQSQYTQAMNYFRECIHIYSKTGNVSGLFNANQNLANAYFLSQQLDSAEYYYMIEMKYALDLGEEALASSHINMADLKTAQKKFDEAAKYYQLALPFFVKNGNARTNAKVYNSLAWCKYNQKQLDASLKYFEASNKINDSLNNYDLKIENFGFMSDIYAEKKDYKNAYEYQTRLEAAKDTMYKELRDENLLQLETKFETFRKEKENQLLKEDNELTKATLQRNRIVLIAAIVCILLFIILLFVVMRSNMARYRNIDALENLNRQLELQRDEIAHMNNKLEIRALRAQMDPHFIFNCMSSIQELILKNDADAASNYLVKFSRLLRMVLENSEHDYVTLEKELEMLRHYLDLENIRLKEIFTYVIDVDKELLDGETMVPTLVIQPFAENAIWHGLLNKEKDRKLLISIKAEDELLVCVIEDNGIGRKLAGEKKMGMTKHASRGMKAIEERLHIIERNISSKSGIQVTDLHDAHGNPSGTRVTIKIPFQFLGTV